MAARVEGRVKKRWATLALCVVLVGCSARAPRAPRTPEVAAAHVRELPIVLVPGFSAFEQVGEARYFSGVAAHLRGRGVPTYEVTTLPYQSSESRARLLEEALDRVLRETGASRAHLIAHSQGGIDARYLMSARGLDRAGAVASLTTLSTPHRGTPLADAFRDTPPAMVNAVFAPLQAAFSTDDDNVLGAVRVKEAVGTMSSEHMRRFNEEHPDPEGVPIFSVAGLTGDAPPEVCDGGTWGPLHSHDPLSAHMAPIWTLVRGDPEQPRANDGLIPVDSAVWGTFLGCVPADHADLIGNSFVAGGSPSHFDPRPLYERLVDNARASEREETW
jgi:triacylglycerol lipase